METSVWNQSYNVQPNMLDPELVPSELDHLLNWAAITAENSGLYLKPTRQIPGEYSESRHTHGWLFAEFQQGEK